MRKKSGGCDWSESYRKVGKQAGLFQGSTLSWNVLNWAGRATSLYSCTVIKQVLTSLITGILIFLPFLLRGHSQPPYSLTHSVSICVCTAELLVQTQQITPAGGMRGSIGHCFPTRELYLKRSLRYIVAVPAAVFHYLMLWSWIVLVTPGIELPPPHRKWIVWHFY